MRLIGCMGIVLLLASGAFGAADSHQAKNKAKPKTPKDRVTEFCRKESASRLKYVKTVEWNDMAREEKPGVWMVSGIRTARGPAGNVDQQYTCRVQLTGTATSLKMIQIFKKASKTGDDIFELK
jgi:hypothetical protein